MRREVDNLQAEEIERLLETYSNSPSGVRYSALTVFLWRTGARISEALDVVPKDLDVRERVCVIHHGKGDKRRVVGLDNLAIEHLDKWMRVREQLGVELMDESGRPATVFCSITKGKLGKRMLAKQARKKFAEAGQRAGLQKRTNPHSFRHTHATELVKEGLPLNTIRQILGHTSIATTDRYISKLHPHAVIEAMAKRAVVGESVKVGTMG